MDAKYKGFTVLYGDHVFSEHCGGCPVVRLLACHGHV